MSAPYLHSDADCRTVHAEMLIALCPAILWGVWRSGSGAALICLFSMLFATLLDLLYEVIVRYALLRQSMRFDGAALLIGLLIAAAMPANISLWVILVADFVAIILCRRLLCGHLAPAATGIALVVLLTGGFKKSFALIGDPVYTPLDELMEGVNPDQSTADLLLGRGAGNIGEIAALLLILGGVYLLIRRRIRWELPAAAIIAAGVVAMEFSPDSVADYPYIGDQIISGGLLLGVLFTVDAKSTPVSPLGRLIFGALVGAATVAVRVWFGLDGVYPAIALLSALVPLIDRLTLPSPFGGLPRHARNQNQKN